MRHCVTSRKVAGSIPDDAIEFFAWPIPSSRTVALDLIQPLTTMNTRKFPGGLRNWPSRKSDNLSAICEKIAYKMQDA
jgi:hypothetical protein